MPALSSFQGSARASRGARRRTTWPVIAILLACVPLLAACDKSTAPLSTSQSADDRSNQLTITTSKSSYDWEEISINGPGLVATISNANALDYFSNIGDGFNASAEQSRVFIAMGTDATIERREKDGTWTVLATAPLYEGSRTVSLRGGGDYELRGHLTEPRQTGTMRVRLRYSDSSEGGKALTDYSAPFTVR